MCLHTLNSEMSETTADNPGMGYKVGEIINGHFVSFFNTSVKFDTWLDATDEILYTEDGTGYTSGFHIFTDKEGAIKYMLGTSFCTIMRVLYYDVVAVGEQTVDYQYDLDKHEMVEIQTKCVVARRMKIIKPEDINYVSTY